MSKQYCFKILNASSFKFNPNLLKNYIKSLYIGRGKNKFTKDEKTPFVILFIKSLDGNNVCIKLTTRGKKNIEKIEKINKHIPTSKLTWQGLKLSKPYEFGKIEQHFWGDIDNKKGVWISIIQSGPYFSHLSQPYQKIGGKLIYNGKSYSLTDKEEQIAMLYAKRLVSEEDGGVVERLTKDNVFNKNFWSNFKSYLTSEHKKIFKNFKNIGWRDLKNKIRKQKEHKITKEEKIAKMIRTEERKGKYGYAKLDGNLEKVGNYTIEPVGLFMGRGKNPLRGKIKKEINPEDVTINIGKNDPIPTPPSGHKWGNIVHDHSAIWLAKWKDTITGNTKYVHFAATGRFKQQSDLAKYEKARKLQRHIDIVRKKYMIDASSQDPEKMQLGTVLWLIDNHGIRPGDERTEDQADTVGASTLRVDHVKLLSNYTIKFDFLGKDSIKFEKSMKVPKIIYNNFKKLLYKRKNDEQVFYLISAASINAYLKQFDINFTNKVFRTRLASHIMFEALMNSNIKIPINATKKKIKILFNKANVKVADVLNHTRSVSMKAQQSLKKLKTQLKELKVKLKEYKKEGKSIKNITARILAKKESIEAKQDTKSVAINTSLTNYIDPRIVVAWTKKQASRIKKKNERQQFFEKLLASIYSTTMIEKFQWAIQSPYVTKDWNWLTSPLQGSDKLKPTNIIPGTINAWCRKKYGKYWYKTNKEQRQSEARDYLANFKPNKIKPNKIKPNKIKPNKIKPNKIISQDSDYKLILRACKSGFRDIKGLQRLKRVKTNLGTFKYPSLEWLYPYTLYSVTENKGNVNISKKFNKLYKLLTE